MDKNLIQYQATVLKTISPEIKKGDVLTLRDDGFYVKKGYPRGTVKRLIGIIKKREINTPNFYPAVEVEWKGDWYKIEKVKDYLEVRYTDPLLTNKIAALENRNPGNLEVPLFLYYENTPVELTLGQYKEKAEDGSLEDYLKEKSQAIIKELAKRGLKTTPVKLDGDKSVYSASEESGKPPRRQRRFKTKNQKGSNFTPRKKKRKK